MKVVGNVSGGVGSYSAVRRYVDLHGGDGLVLAFTDTLCEDQDAYRFLIASSADLLGVALPLGFVPDIADFPAWEDRDAYKTYVHALARRTTQLMPALHWLSDGRDVFDVYEDERFLGNSRVDPCSRILKRDFADHWRDQNIPREGTVLIFGIDVEEQHRFDAGNGRGLRPRMASMGWTALAPLCDAPWSTWRQRVDQLAERGLWLPRLNALGFAHNNCGGFCCKAGHGHWKDMLRIFPERYAYASEREQRMRVMLGNVAMLTDRRGDGRKKPLTLEALRRRDLTPEESSDKGGCHCFLGDDGA